MMDITDLARRIASQEAERPKLPGARVAELLRAAYQAFRTPHTFKPGDLVREKDNFFTGSKRKYGIVAISDPEELASAFAAAGKPAATSRHVNLILFLLDTDGDVCEVGAEAFRYEKWDPTQQEIEIPQVVGTVN